MSKAKKKTKTSLRHRPRRHKKFRLEIEEIPQKEEPKKALTWPGHMLVFGEMLTGKTSLIANVLDDIEELYNFRGSQTHSRQSVGEFGNCGYDVERKIVGHRIVQQQSRRRF